MCEETKIEKTAARQTQTSARTFAKAPPKRNCFSLLNICSTNTCRVLYKNCILCNRRNDYQIVSYNKLSELVPCNKNLKLDQVVDKPSTLEKRFCLIGFISFQFTYDKVENATIEHILEYRFIFDDPQQNHLLNVDLKKAEEIESPKASAIENFSVTTLECGLSINITFKILVTFGIILSLWVIYLLYRKSVSTIEIK